MSEKTRQMSDAFLNSAFLALSGGFQDAYTYNARDEVFSNAQTGNVVLMSQHLIAGDWSKALHYLFPLIAFALGVAVAEQIQGKYKNARKMHWRQGILLMEIAILFAVGLIPVHYNMVANALVSFACAMQVQAFRKVDGYSYASTMCIGNLRGGVAAFSSYRRTKKPYDLEKAKHYFGIILLFALGAGIGGNLSILYGQKAIWVSCILLTISFLLMFKKERKESKFSSDKNSTTGKEQL